MLSVSLESRTHKTLHTVQACAYTDSPHFYHIHSVVEKFSRFTLGDYDKMSKLVA